MIVGAADRLKSDAMVLGRRFVYPETTLLALVGVLDLASTVILLASGRAIEANPLLAGILRNYGITAFILFKTFAIAGPLAGAEIARLRHPRFVRGALRSGLALYLLLYVAGVLALNGHGQPPA